MRTKIIALSIIGTAAAMWLQGCSAFAQDTNLPPQIVAQLPAQAAPFDPNGMSFTNVNYKIGIGSEISSSGGTLSYAQGDINLFRLKSFDIGLGTETTFSGTGSGVHSAAGDLELAKDFSNWQLVGKAGYGHVFDGIPGNYLKLGFDVNYNLTKGANLPWLGTSGGAFTYVFAGVSWANKDLSLNQQNVDKSFRFGIGYAF